MKVIVAKTAGFCWGVRRAMDAVLEASARPGSQVQTLGPLIHNPQALALLERRGVRVVQDPEAVKGGTVLVRAHGLPIAQLRELRARHARRELELVNATCPEVAKVHSRILKWSPKGYFTVILGTKGHAESVAHESFAASGAAIVQNLEEARALPDACLRKALVVAQTTFTTTDFRAIVEELAGRAGDLIVENTICRDTTTRQEEAQVIARSVDAVVVVGGRNSANTRHLVELARQHGHPVQYVEVASELDLEGFRGMERIGVLAGASTPTWLVEEVVEALETLAKGPERVTRCFRALLGTPLSLGLGAAFMTVGVHAWMGISPGFGYPAVAGLYVLGMYLLSPFLDPAGLGTRGPGRERALLRGRALFLGLGSAALGAALLLSAQLGTGTLLTVLLASAAGLLYRQPLRMGGRLFSLQGIPGSKDVLVTLALAVLTVAVPLWHHDLAWTPRAWAGVLLVAALVFARTVIRGIQDMQNDRILGQETLPILLGARRTKWLLAVLLALALVSALVLTPWASLRQPVIAGLALLSAMVYPLLHLWAFHERFTTGRVRHQPPLELAFALLGLLALA